MFQVGGTVRTVGGEFPERLGQTGCQVSIALKYKWFHHSFLAITCYTKLLLRFFSFTIHMMHFVSLIALLFKDWECKSGATWKVHHPSKYLWIPIYVYFSCTCICSFTIIVKDTLIQAILCASIIISFKL